MDAQNRFAKSFKENKNTVVIEQINSLQIVQRNATGLSFSIEFSKENLKNRVSGLYTKHETLRMQEASDFELIDMTSPFLDLLVDRFFGFEDADVLPNFCRYIEIMHTVSHVYGSSEWYRKNSIASTDSSKLLDDVWEVLWKTIRYLDPVLLSSVDWSLWRWYSLNGIIFFWIALHLNDFTKNPKKAKRSHQSGLSLL